MSGEPAVSTEDLIPDFCGWRPLLLVAVIMLLVAVVLTLASGVSANGFRRLALIALYLEWMGFCSAAALCTARRWLRNVDARVVFGVCWGLLVGVTLVVSAVGYQVMYGAVDPARALVESRGAFMFRHVCIGAVVSLLILNYFWLQQRWRGQVRAEGELRYQALQARIRPHFLFNSLNSIASLISVKPDDAERLIEDLSELMRASLELRNRLVPLTDEIELATAYLHIEQVRLGERLKIEWEISEDARMIELPLLSVQPLVENAIYHGLERMTEPGTLRIVARRIEMDSGAGLVVEVWNPLPGPGTAPAREGQRMAVNNIAQRLSLIYGERAKLELGLEGDRYVARLTLPWVTDVTERGTRRRA